MSKKGVYSRREGEFLGMSHIVVERGYILGGRDRFWEGRTYEFVEKGGYILGGRGRFWEGRTYKFVEKGGMFWEGGVDFGIRRHFSKSHKWE